MNGYEPAKTAVSQSIEMVSTVNEEWQLVMGRS